MFGCTCTANPVRQLQVIEGEEGRQLWHRMLERATFPKALTENLCAAAARKVRSTQLAQHQDESAAQHIVPKARTSRSRHSSTSVAHAVAESSVGDRPHPGSLHTAASRGSDKDDLEDQVPELKMVILEDSVAHNDGCDTEQ